MSTKYQDLESSISDELQNHVPCTAQALRGHNVLKVISLFFHRKDSSVPSRVSETQHMEKVLGTPMKKYILLCTALGSISILPAKDCLC